MTTLNNSTETAISSSGSQQGNVAETLFHAHGLHPFLFGLNNVLRNKKETDEEHHVNKCFVDNGIILTSIIALFLALFLYL